MSLNPCLDALLIEVAEPGQILALSHYSRDPASSSIRADIAQRHAITGGTVEEVLALEPDLVLASTYMPPATRAAFERLGLKVETFGAPQTAAESYEQIRRVATLAANRERAEDLIASIEAALTDAALKRQELGHIDALLWQSGEIVAGESALVTRVLSQAGFGRDANREAYAQGERVSLEQLVADPPELVLVAGGSRGQNHPVLSRLEGMRVETLDPKLFYCGGPSLIALTQRLDQIREGMAR